MGLKMRWKAKPRNLPQRVMYWSYSHDPNAFIGRATQVPAHRVNLVVAFLKTGHRSTGYLGWAECRICGERLGTADMTAEGYQWPSRAEHYIIEHGVWTPKLDALGRALEVIYMRSNNAP